MPAVVVPHTQGFARLSVGLRRVWARLGQGSEPAEREAEGLRIPFVDYARGDGLRIGPQQQHTWDQRLLQAGAPAPAPDWGEAYVRALGVSCCGSPGGNAPPRP